ncbi:hypothetical protein HanIR_Chr07g0334871 [Helianthus annuus]|nr:hypothetical protein HanIR_Chr07g0334871 [Helianthus annuus]
MIARSYCSIRYILNHGKEVHTYELMIQSRDAILTRLLINEQILGCMLISSGSNKQT